MQSKTITFSPESAIAGVGILPIMPLIRNSSTRTQVFESKQIQIIHKYTYKRMKLNLHSWQQLTLPVALTAISLGALSSCQDYDAGFTSDTFKKVQYTKHFEELFGNIDPEQDWSMAALVTANLNVSGDATAYVYTEKPGHKGAYLAGIVTGNSAQFNLLKGTEQVYVMVEQNNEYIVSGYFDVENNIININSSPVEKKQSLTRSASGAFSVGSKLFTQTAYSSDGSQSWDATYYRINGNTTSSNVQWTLGDCYNLFWGGDAVFKEGESYRTVQHKLDAYAKYNTSVEELEKGVLFTTSKNGAKIDIPFMFGATQNDNIFGYYYYEDDQDPLTVNRYVLYEDAQPSKNIKVDGTFVGDMDLQQIQDGWLKTSVATCPSRSLIYFGKDGNSAGSVEFPKDVKIGFFIMRQHRNSGGSLDYSAYDKDAGTTRTYGEAGWAYSDPDLNLKYIYDNSGNTSYKATWGHRDLDNETHGNVKAITWMYDGRILCGFGDDSGDRDLNDFVWWVDGDVKETPKIRITSQSSSSWIVACEDLGGTFDYDFNDLVFALRKTQFRDDQTKATLELVPLAAGGTLNAKVYYDGSEKGEIHDLVVPGSDSGTPLNVTAGTKPAAGTPILLENEIAWNADINDIITNNVAVKVIQEQGQNAVESSYFINAYKKGESSVPQMMILPSGWDWPAERVPVDKVYAGFGTWASDAAAVTWCYNKDGERASECVTDPLPDVTITTEYFEDPSSGDDVVGGDVELNKWTLTIVDMVDEMLLGNSQQFEISMSPAESDLNNIEYTFDVPGIVSISKNYKYITIKALAAGPVNITMSYDNPTKFGYEKSSTTYTLRVVEGTGTTESPWTCYNSNPTWYVGVSSQFNQLINLPYGYTYDTQRLIGEVIEGNDVVSIDGNSFKGLKPGTAKVRITAPADDTYAAKSFELNVTITKKPLQINAPEFMVKVSETANNIFNIPEDYDGTITGTSSLGTLTGTSFTAGDTPGSGTIQLSCTETDLYTAGNCGTINVMVYGEKVEETITSDFASIEGSVFEGASKVVFRITAENQKTYYKFHTDYNYSHDWEFNDIWNDIVVSGGDLTYLIQNGLTLVTSDGLTSLTYTIYK